MKRSAITFLAVLLALVMTVGCMPAFSLYVTDDKVSTYTVLASEVHNLGDGLVYNEYSFKDGRGVYQTCFTMEFNPTSSDFRSYVYHSQASHGYTIVDDVKNAQKEGLEVYAAINGDFFSMETANYGTPIGMYVSAGKLSVASVGLSEYNFVIAKDGTADVVYSKLGYDLTIGGTDYTSKLSAINKRAGDYGTNSIFYFDSDIGTYTPTSVTGNRNEFICDVTEGSLSVGGTIKGKVSAIRDKGYSPIGAGQFVISAGTGLDLSAVAVGTEVSLSVEETVEDSKEVMENAYHAIYAYQTMKVDGHDRWASGELVNPDLSEQYAQRSVVGIKEDGTLIYMVCDGRKNNGDLGINGFDYDMIMEIMEPYNCTDIVNFDGGGSTSVVLSEDDGKLNYEFIGAGMGEGRTVANSILIVRDPNADPIEKPEPTPIVDKENTELRNVAINKTYSLIQYGSGDPVYLSTSQGDTGTKLTNGKYRSSADSSDSLSVACIGTGLQIHMTMDLAKERDDIRSVTWRGVSITGNRSLTTNNLIVYLSDDGIHWGPSVAGTVEKADNGVSGVYDVTYKFTESQSGRYVKLVFGNSTYALQFDEIEVNAMVDKSEPIEKPVEEDVTDLPADEPSEYCENVALGSTYTITCKGSTIAAHDSGVDPRYYNAYTAETTPQRLTDGKLGTGGTFSDGATLAMRTGSNAAMEIIIDLGEEKSDIEFVRLLNIIDNAGSFGKIDSADVSYSTDGTSYSTSECRYNSAAVLGTHYYSVTVQYNQPVSARYIKINFTTPKFLFGMGEIQVLTSAVEPAYTLGDVNDDGEIDSLDAAAVLKYDAGILAEISEAADVNGDGEVDSLDAAAILKYDAGIITEF